MPTIVVPLDGTALSEQAIRSATRLAHWLDGSLRLVHVAGDPALPGASPLEAEAEAYLARVRADHPNGLPLGIEVRRGDPARELVALTQQSPDTLLVMATHGRTGLPRLLYGSVTDKVVRGAGAPVLLVKDGVDLRPGLRSILVPLDGSALSEQALPVAVVLAQRTLASLVLVRVIDGHSGGWLAEANPVSPGAEAELRQEVAEWQRDEARSYLDRTASRLRLQDVSVTWEARTGRPTDEIVRAATTTNADLIVMSTRGRGGLRRLALGSVTGEVIQKTQAPLLIVPPGASQALGAGPLAHDRSGSLERG